MKLHRLLAFFSLTFIFLGTLASCNRRIVDVPEDSIPPVETQREEKVLSFDNRRFSYYGESEDISAEEDIITIRRKGAYRLTGRLTEGRIRISCRGEVRLILDNFSGSSSYGPLIEADRGVSLTVETAKDSINTLSSADYKGDGIFPSSCILAWEALFCGEGSATVRSKGDAAITCLSSASFEGGRFSLSGRKYGLWTRDAFSMNGGRLTVTDADYGICASDGENAIGRIEISGGELTAICKEGVLFAGRSIEVIGGSTTYDCKKFYICVRTENGKTLSGKINVTAVGFPQGNK